MKLLIGLGNPGGKYITVRHNVGFTVVDKLAEELEDKKWELDKKFKAQIMKLTYTKKGTSYIGEFANQFLNKETFPVKETEQVLLAKPQTYMNNSGIAVKLLTTYYQLPASDVIVVHDELDLPLGKIKIRLGGSAAGHHGVESIINTLGTDQFIRVRLGIGNLRTQSGEHKGQTVGAEKFVLEPFLRQEKPQVKHMLKQAVKALTILLDKGVEAAQSQFN